MEPIEVRIGDAQVLVEIDDLDSPSWKGAVVDWKGAIADGALEDEQEVIVYLAGDDGERTSRARVVSTGPYEPAVLEGLEAFR